jgi:hypothetical protein
MISAYGGNPMGCREILRTCWFQIAVVSSLLGPAAYAEAVKDPERHFLAGVPREPNCLWRLRADLNADGLPEELFTLSTRRNARAGHIWQVYVGTRSGFVVASEFISFRTDAAFIGNIREIEEPGLLAYFPGGRSQGALIVFQVKESRLVERPLGQIRPLDSDAAMYQRYFTSARIRVEKRPVFGGECLET